MSKYQLRKTIKKELRDLNWKIDMKIVRGLSYKTEARRHKFLVMQFNRLSKQGSILSFLGLSNPFTRSFGI